jgi:hypothetical protein
MARSQTVLKRPCRRLCHSPVDLVQAPLVAEVKVKAKVLMVGADLVLRVNEADWKMRAHGPDFDLHFDQEPPTLVLMRKSLTRMKKWADRSALLSAWISSGPLAPGKSRSKMATTLAALSAQFPR